jgi:hypothetical protein
MATYSVHIDGIPAQLPWKTIATFPIGTFLENIAVRENGTLLVSSMLAGEIFFLDPNAEDSQATLKRALLQPRKRLATTEAEWWLKP